MNSEAHHFIYELLQNSDDTEYDSDPIVNICYSNNRLLFECNEIGFTEADVEALCDAMNSTKKKKTSARRPIGEKGIGFKSVFKVCSIVWIQSGEYQFKFDKNLPFGRIRPTWDPFPTDVPTTAGYTKILIQLDPGHDKKIRSALEAMDPIILLFLQQVRCVNISILTNGFMGIVRRPAVSTRLEAQSIPEISRILHRVRCERNRSGSSLLVFKYPVVGLPSHKLRAHVSDAEIILAFPENLHTSREAKSGGVYAYLPVAKYGFKVSHSFLLSSSSSAECL